MRSHIKILFRSVNCSYGDTKKKDKMVIITRENYKNTFFFLYTVFFYRYVSRS